MLLGERKMLLHIAHDDSKYDDMYIPVPVEIENIHDTTDDQIECRIIRFNRTVIVCFKSLQKPNIADYVVSTDCGKTWHDKYKMPQSEIPLLITNVFMGERIVEVYYM